MLRSLLGVFRDTLSLPCRASQRLIAGLLVTKDPRGGGGVQGLHGDASTTHRAGAPSMGSGLNVKNTEGTLFLSLPPKCVPGVTNTHPIYTPPSQMVASMSPCSPPALSFTYTLPQDLPSPLPLLLVKTICLTLSSFLASSPSPSDSHLRTPTI